VELKLQTQALWPRTGGTLQESTGVNTLFVNATMRIKQSFRQGRWDYNLHYLASGVYSENYTSWSAAIPQVQAPRYFDWRRVILDKADGEMAHTLDRASMRYTSDYTVIRIGRQALTWGHGQIFHPMDLFNPFSPYASDTANKSGTDMVYGQYLFPSGSDVQVLAVPRRNSNAIVTAEQSSLAAKAMWFSGSIETTVLVARDRRDDVGAVGASGPWGGAVWKMDVLNSRTQEGDAVLSAVTSVHNSWDWRQKPLNAFVEYYRNGYGVDDSRAFDRLPPALMTRLLRGQVFNTGRDYVATGMMLAWTPLLQLQPSFMVNANDGSGLLRMRADYNLSDSMNLIVDIQIPFGSLGSEFGGRKWITGSEQYESIVRALLIRLEWYL